MCNKLDIRRSSYYKWLNRPIPENEQKNSELAEIIMDDHESYGGILGYRRMRLFINRDNQQKYNTKRIHRIRISLGFILRLEDPETAVRSQTDQTKRQRMFFIENLKHRILTKNGQRM